LNYNRLHPNYPYKLDNGLPDLVYNAHTDAIICDVCKGESCLACYKSGYRFLDPKQAKNKLLELYDENCNKLQNRQENFK